MRLTWLADELRAAGLTVVEDDGWRLRGGNWRPSGGMQHHTAPPVPYPVDALNGSRDGLIRCNLNVKPDGTVVVIAAGACNYSSGTGSGVVLHETRQDVAPWASARARGLGDTVGGNSHYFNVETDHAGDGRALPAAQQQAMVGLWTVMCRTMGWTANRVIAHAEWSSRKIDPYWDDRRAHLIMVDMRAAVQAALDTGFIPNGEKMLKRGDTGRQVRRLQKKLNNTPNPPEPPLTVDGQYGPATEQAVFDWQTRREIPNPDGRYDAFTRADVEAQAHNREGHPNLSDDD